MRALLFLLLLSPVLSVFAQKADPAAVFRNQYRIRSWGTADGLGSAKINAVYADRKGFLWVATQRGLYRFDGLHFSPVTASHLPGLEKTTFLDVTGDERGIIWAGTMETGLVRIEGDSVRHYARENSRIPVNIQKAVHIDAAGTVWSGAYHGGLTRLDADTVTAVYGSVHGLESDAIWTITSDAPGRLWVGTNGGIFRFYDGRFNRVTAPLGLGNPIVRSLLSTGPDSLWIGTDGGGITQIIHSQTVDFVNSTHGLQNDFVLGLLKQPVGLWLGTYGAGVIRYTGNNAIAISKFSGLSNNFVFDIEESPGGTLWAATDDGLNALLPRRFSWITTADGLNEDQQFGLFADSKGRMWASPNGGGAQYLEQGNWKSITLKEGLPLTFVYAFAEDRDQNIWIGTQGGGLYRLNRGKIDVSVSQMRDRFVRVVKTTRDGSIWFGTGKGLHRMADPVSDPKTFQVVNDSLFVSNLIQRKNGDVVVSTYGNGLFVFDSLGALKKHFWKQNSAMPDRLFSLFEDENERLWVGSRSEGIAVLEGDRITRLGTNRGFPDSAPAIVQDKNGTLWIGIGTYGLLGFPEQELERALSDSTIVLHPFVLNEADGLPATSANSGFSGGNVMTPDGTLWFSTMKGIVGFNPETLHSIPEPKPFLRGIRLEGKTLKPLQSLLLEESDRGLEIDYSASVLQAPEKAHFKYRMAGLTATWTDAGKRTTAYFPSLPHGEYTFEVTVTDPVGRFSNPIQLLSISVASPWWMRWWIVTGFVVLAALPLVGLYQLVVFARVRRLKRSLEIQRELQTERTRISRDLHDSVGANLTNLIAGLEIARTFIDKRQSKRARAWLETMDADARTAMQELRESIWLLDRDNVSASELIAHIRAYVHKTTPYAPELHINITEQISSNSLFSSNESLHLLRLIQEAIHNCRKHARATELHLYFTCTGSACHIELRDNGSGFIVEEKRGTGNGLLNMENRARQIGAECSITSHPGSGTTILVTLKTKPGNMPA
jgi:signal transduction histidine kinase/ligand-binding sensor domain-containing protein